jgi:antitoxin component YwqK of YwqJK toxin-antitoxin module
MNKNTHGLHTEHLDNGMRLETTYKDGIKYGRETYWYESGKKASAGFYEDNKLEGVLTAWNEDGLLESEQEYKNGILNGKSIFYEDGVRAAEYILNNGEISDNING